VTLTKRKPKTFINERLAYYGIIPIMTVIQSSPTHQQGLLNMARPQKARKFEALPSPVIYLPAGWSKGDSKAVEIAIEDFEIMRLVDGQGLHLEEAAEKVGVSRSTAGRMLERARRGIAMGIEKRVPLYLDAGEELVIETSQIKPKAFPKVKREEGQTLLAVACRDANPDSPVEQIFGRAPAFVLIGKEENPPVRVDNPGFGVKHHAAGLAIKMLLEHGVTGVVAGRFGSEALQTLAHNKIQVLVSGSMNLGQTMDYLKRGNQ
jgi:predicted DNA-binding protein (UPF0251 family)/predicted Fe-Mo cluster-binding NifX family protein